MGILPVNKKKTPKETPRNFVIFGGTMHGKTFFSEEFPNPLNLNTDGNAEMIETPSINISHQRNAKGEIIKGASDLLSQVIVELEGTKHTYETIVVDVIDDIITLFEQEITEEEGVKTVGEIGWGKGHNAHEMMVRVLVMRLKELSMKKNVNILYLSRLNSFEENGVMQYSPSLKTKWMNIVNGNSDYTILCRKIGKKYLRQVESKRKNYTREMMDDDRIVSLLDTVIGAYDKSKSTPVNEAKKIVAEEEKQKEVEQKVKEVERNQEVKKDKLAEPDAKKEPESVEAKQEPKPAPKPTRRPARPARPVTKKI